MISLNSMSTAAATSLDDADLVRRSLVGGTPAFAQIVARYQTLICSLTYNATGNLSRSEDLAQEVFLTAWKELRLLREPEKLRSWLCGIARRLTANVRRKEGREPICAAEELQDEHHTSTPGPVEQAISREEEAILWRALEQIPENYREPLILFYREGQSVEQVASALELTEDTAKQRLSRGRKLLQDQVERFVEGALRMSTPGRAFTLGVLAALPLMKTSAAAATLGTAAAKTGTAAAGLGLLGILGILSGPIAGGLGAWFGVRANLDAAESEEERRLIRRQAGSMIGLVIAFFVLMGFAMPFEFRIWHERTGLAVTLGSLLPVLYVVVLMVMIFRFRRTHLRLRAAQAASRSPETAARFDEAWRTFEYISPWKFLGLPLVHIRSGRPRGAELRPAIGWIAIGDLAIGVILSVGGFAIGGISIGGFSIGLIAMGGVSLGLVAFAGIALGLYGAIGGLAIGYFAYGGCAIAWHVADGGMAAARHFALGESAWAIHANDAAAREADRASAFFGFANWLTRHPLFFAISWCPVWLVVWQAQRARRILKQKAA